MVTKLLRRLAGRSRSTNRDDGTRDGTEGRQRPITERRGRAEVVRAPLPAAWLRMQVWRRDQGKCVRCGDQERVWFDYIIPVREGGSNTEDNIRLLCELCAQRNKGASIRIRRKTQGV
jgi:hypothetical protein